MTLISMTDVMKDLYAMPGAHLKQWVVDTRSREKWIGNTCPAVDVGPHDDNTGMPCDVRGLWYHLEGHPHCYTCNDAAEASRTREDVAAWLVALAARPAVESDRSKLSDPPEFQEDYSMREHPLLAFTRGAK